MYWALFSHALAHAAGIAVTALFFLFLYLFSLKRFLLQQDICEELDPAVPLFRLSKISIAAGLSLASSCCAGVLN
jgi:hypothetical protein